MVCDRDKPHPQGRENLLQVPSRLYIFPAKTGKILYDHKIGFSLPHILHHLPETRAPEVRAGIAIVYVNAAFDTI